MMLQILTAGVVVIWLLYWEITSYLAVKNKPKTKKRFIPWWLRTIVVLTCLGLFFLMQLFQKTSFLNFPQSQFVMGSGFILTLIAFFILIKARIDLGHNWTSGWEYQIKEKHELVTTGIYHFVRHPIYAGIILLCIGIEMVCSSWLCLWFIGLLLPAYLQGKREENILIDHFKEKYIAYMNKTKMFIPGIL